MEKFIFDIQRFAAINNTIGGDSTVGVTLKNDVDNTIVTGTAYADSIVNSGDNVSIYLVGGNDTLSNTGDNVTVTSENISLTSDALTGDKLVISVDKSSSIPHITIPSGISNNTTVTVGAGVYNVGQSAQVTVNDAFGFLYVDGVGNVTAEDFNVAYIRMVREQAIAELVAGIDTPTVGALHDFYNFYYGQNTIFSGWTSTVAGYTNVASSTRSENSVSSGVNIYGDTALGNYPSNVTLQSFVSNPINIEHIEGLTDGATMKNAVIDASNSNNTLIALGMNENENSFATNHTILGSARQSTILVGDKATGDNVIKAGDGGNFIYNTGYYTSIYGGAGSDSIYSANYAYAEGGGGADYFFDAGSYEIADYNFAENDVIIATKLSTNATLTPDKLSLSGNKISVADGATLTLGDDDSSAAKVIVADAVNSKRTNLIWAGTSASSLDASNLTKGAMMISSVNGGSNTIIGSDYADSIYSGNGDYINAGSGNDIISLVADHSGISIALSEGGNSVYNFNANDTLLVEDTNYSTVISGNDLILSGNSSTLQIVDGATLTPNILVTIPSGENIDNTIEGAVLTGTKYNDTISNSGSNVTINALDGDDTITNTDNNKTYIDAGDGDNYISNSLKYSVETIDGSETLISEYSDTSIVAGVGNDTINNVGGSYVSIVSGEGDDSIYSKHSYYNTIDAGAGNDWIGISDGHYQNIFLGDGDDTLQGVQEMLGDKASKWDVGGYANIDGGAGDDVISFGYANDSTITGGEGNDYIVGFGAKSFITGGDGNDEIVLVPTKDSSRDSTGATISGGQGNDTVTLVDDADVVYSYEGGNDVIYLLSANDTLNIATDDAYITTVNGDDLIVSLKSSQNTITLKDAATITPNIIGNLYEGYLDKDGNEIENPVAMIASGDSTYYYESVARAANDADNNSTVTVIADSTETATINTTKNLAIQFAESGLGVYSVSGGNFISSDVPTTAQFNFTSNRILSNNDKNYLLINNGSTATLDSYAITGTSTGYEFTLQDSAFIYGDISYSGAGTATFNTRGTISLTGGAVVNGNNEVTSTTGISLAAGNYTINGAAITTTTDKTIYANGEDIQFNLASDTVTYNDMTFSGSGYATIKDDLPTLSAGVSISRPERAMVVLTERGQNTIDGRGFWLTEKLSDGITVGAVDNGIGVAHIIPKESFPEDAGKLFAEEALIYGDDSYTVRLNKDGIKSIYGLSAGSTVRGTAYFEGEVDTLGSILQLVVDGSGSYTFGDKTYSLSGAVDSVNVVAFSSRFYTEGTSALKNIYYLNGTVSGDFSSEVTINQASMGVQVLGDTNINVYATDSARAIDDAGRDIISSSGNVSVISGVGNGASIVSAGGATKVTTNEEGSFIFRNANDSLQGQQAFTVRGDNSVDFILRNFTDANGNPTMQVEGINNFENGLYTITKETEYHAINAGESITADDELVMQFSDKATFVIADSKIVSVSGIDTLINRLKGDVTVHATHAVTVNELDANVVGDTDFDVIVSDSKTVKIANISAGASLSVSSVLVETDNNGDFNFGTETYTINDIDKSVTFVTGSNKEVENITNFEGTLKSSAQSVTVNGTAFTTSNTDASIISAGVGISRIQNLTSGDTVSGELESTTVVMSSEGKLTINEIDYTLNGDKNGIEITGKRIDGLDNEAALVVGAAGTYTVNNTNLSAKIGDTIIGTAEGAAYIYDSNNVPLDMESMTDEEIQSQAGISTTYGTVETDTMMTSQLIANGGSALNGSMELALDNSDANIEQTADFSNTTGRKKVTLEGGDQNVAFNNEGGNVAVIDDNASGEKNVTLGGGGDLIIVKGTNSTVNITAGNGADTVVTAGFNVHIAMRGGATKIVPNSGNLTLNNYDASTGAGVQINNAADLTRAIGNGNINLGDGQISFGDTTVNFGNENAESTIVNLFNNQGRKQKVAYTHSEGGAVDASGERESMLLVGNTGNKNGESRLTAGNGNDTAIGGSGDYFDLGGGNNYVEIGRRGNTEGATVAMTTSNSQTQVDGFNTGYDENSDKVRIDTANAKVSFAGGKITFSVDGSKLILNVGLGSSADLFDDDNFIGSTTIDDITPITYEQGEYQFGEENWTTASGQISLAGAQ